MSVGSVSAWEWKVEGAETVTSNEQHPEFTFAQAGRYKVTLTVRNPYNSSTKSANGYLLVVPSGDLSAFLPFNNMPEDAGPNAIEVSAVGGGVTFTDADRFGAAGRTATFNGSSGIKLADHAATNFGTGDYTVALWMKSSSATRMMLWQESGRNGSKDNQTWLRLNDNGTDRQMRFCIEDGVGSTFVNLGAPAR